MLAKKAVNWSRQRLERLYQNFFREEMLKPLMVVRSDRAYPVNDLYEIQRDDVFCFMTDYLYYSTVDDKKCPFYRPSDSLDYPLTVRNYLQVLGTSYEDEVAKVAKMLNDIKLALTPSADEQEENRS